MANRNHQLPYPVSLVSVNMPPLLSKTWWKWQTAISIWQQSKLLVLRGKEMYLCIAHLQWSLRLVYIPSCSRFVISDLLMVVLKMQIVVAVGGRPISICKWRMQLEGVRLHVAIKKSRIENDHYDSEITISSFQTTYCHFWRTIRN